MTAWTPRLWMAPLACGVALLASSPAFACDETDGFKVVFAAGPFASAHPRGSMLCGVDEVDIAVGDFVVLRRGDRIWRFQRAGRYKLAQQESQPTSVLAVLARYMNPSSWGLERQTRNGAVKALSRKPEDNPEGGLHPEEPAVPDAVPANIRLSRAAQPVMVFTD